VSSLSCSPKSFPEAKRRQFKSALDAYEAALRDTAGTGSVQASEDGGTPLETREKEDDPGR
jgi:hypothetical protein